MAKSGAGCAAACGRTSIVSLLRPDADSADVLCTGAAPLAGGLAAGAARCASAPKLPSAETLTSGEAPCSPCGVAGNPDQPAALARLQRRAQVQARTWHSASRSGPRSGKLRSSPNGSCAKGKTVEPLWRCAHTCSRQECVKSHRCADGRHQVIQLHVCVHILGREHVLLPRQCVRSDRRWGPARHVAARLPRATRTSQPLGDARLYAGERRAGAGTQASHTLETLPHAPLQTPSCCCCSRLHSHQGAARRPAWPSSSVRTTTSPISDAAGRAVLFPDTALSCNLGSVFHSTALLLQAEARDQGHHVQGAAHGEPWMPLCAWPIGSQQPCDARKEWRDGYNARSEPCFGTRLSAVVKPLL